MQLLSYVMTLSKRTPLVILVATTYCFDAMTLYRGAYKELNNLMTLNILIIAPMKQVVKVLPITYSKG